MQLLTPSHWQDYELIDSGLGEKLERFGAYTLARPEPQAVWDKALSEAEWARLSDARFVKAKGQTAQQDRGEWVTKKGMPDRWLLGYRHGGLNLNLRLGMTAFKHVGVFPEQAENWDYLYETLSRFPKQQPPQVLNLFAYTGGASLAARAAGAEVVHVDSVKQVISWARENMEASRLDGIRWVVEDAFKFVAREVKRGKRYQGILLDPPAYGRGPDGEKWVLEEQINELMKMCAQLLDPEQHVFLANLYSMGFSALVLENLVGSAFGQTTPPEMGELYLADRANRRLPLGVFLRFARG